MPCDGFIDVMLARFPAGWEPRWGLGHIHVPKTFDCFFRKRCIPLSNLHYARSRSRVKRGMTEVVRWAHAHRKFYDAQSSNLMRSTVMLAYPASAGLLYDVEREAKEMKLDAQGRLALRQAKSVPILDDIKAYLEREQPNVLPKSPERQAIAYTLSDWEALIRYCEDGDLETDNNGAERSLRGIAVGRKNPAMAGFFGSDNGGRTGAILTSLITTCKRLHMYPFAYLRDVFQRIGAHPAKRLEDLLADNWKAAQNTAQNLPA